jgi:hypothetical protein
VTRDDTPTLCALGVLAYIAETMLHEAGGHGTACLALGGTITALGPLWMRCSVTGAAMLAAGPLANLLGGALAAAWLWVSPPAGARLRHALLLFLMFNLLVAPGYLAVGGALGFGDWAGVFAPVSPLAWRIPAALLGLAGVALALRLLAALLARSQGEGALAPAAVTRRLQIPAAAACLVAVAAALAGPWLGAGLLLLPAACTLGVGLLAGSIARATDAAPPHAVARSAALIALAALAAAGFVLGIGPAPALAAARP